MRLATNIRAVASNAVDHDKPTLINSAYHQRKKSFTRDALMLIVHLSTPALLHAGTKSPNFRFTNKQSARARERERAREKIIPGVLKGFRIKVSVTYDKSKRRKPEKKM